jgi:hypothetical protein
VPTITERLDAVQSDIAEIRNMLAYLCDALADESDDGQQMPICDLDGRTVLMPVGDVANGSLDDA